MTAQMAERRNLAALPRGQGRGPGGQSAGLALPAGSCPVPGCDEQIDRTRLMCRRDWHRVPRRLRDRVWRSWQPGRGSGSGAHQQAVRRAIAAARVARTPIGNDG
jgi:hypothetical protein